MATLCLVMVCVATGKMKKKGVSTANEGAIGIREGRTLDFSKGAFGDVPNDGILPELCSGEQRRIVAHLEEPSEISSSSSSVVSCAGCVEKSLLWSWPMQVGLRMRLGSHPLDYINCGPQVHGSRSRARNGKVWRVQCHGSTDMFLPVVPLSSSSKFLAPAAVAMISRSNRVLTRHEGSVPDIQLLCDDIEVRFRRSKSR